MAAAARATAALAPEIQLAQRLAANEKVTRDRAVRKLRKYISAKTQRSSGGFSHDEMLKIWKGLFYCMWMQDKPLLQEALGNTISQLIHDFQNAEAQHLFLQTFWQTMNREWNGIDRLRLDKFYMLIRMVLNQSFEVVKRNGWEESQIELLLDMLMKEILHPDSHAPNGVKFHFIDLYLEELAKVGAEELTADQNLKFIDPLCRIAAKSKDSTLVEVIVQDIFETIIDQAPFAIEDLMRELKANEKASELSGEEQTSRKRSRKQDRGTKAKASSREDDPELEEEEEEDGDDDDEEQRAPHRNADKDIGPVLQFNFEAVGHRLFELSSRQNIPAFNRNCLYKLVQKFQNLAEGIFPRTDFLNDVSTDDDDDTFSRKRKRKRRTRAKVGKEGDGKEKSRARNRGEESGMKVERKKKKVKKRKKNN
ncbi:ribosomal RNA processing protein 1 homolog A [Ornithorhynchus anatinus]|uniref:ribosomal RNA processing protein 1 homolog A n=1 Tax=Ornithorhynchus anatinus TaxID=9258 RepID=UPI0010A843D0|nr:ribosomal RNA processing protein 1 homolog A [Ornithorhynchus anatinus]